MSLIAGIRRLVILVGVGMILNQREHVDCTGGRAGGDGTRTRGETEIKTGYQSAPTHQTGGRPDTAAQTQDVSRYASSLFRRTSNNRLSSAHILLLTNTSLEACAVVCLTQQYDGKDSAGSRYQCKSFDYDHAFRSCLLFSVSLADKDVRLISSTDKDHYETAYLRQFRSLPRHMLPGSHSFHLPAASSLEQCAQRCFTDTSFTCVGFNARRRSQTNDRSESGSGGRGGSGTVCSLFSSNVAATSRTGLVSSNNTDYFERLPDGPLQSFINFGQGYLIRTSANTTITDSTEGETSVSLAGVGLETCAELCLNQSEFVCQSFDMVYSFSGSLRSNPSNQRNQDKSVQDKSAPDSLTTCQLSPHTLTTGSGMSNVDRQRRNHYERIGTNMKYFLLIPWAELGGANQHVRGPITADQCAFMCLRETAFICRSFDYNLSDGGTCRMNIKTAHTSEALETMSPDFSVLIDPQQQQQQAFRLHGEMKSFHDCGGELFESKGELASPNWPQHYSPNMDCTWSILVSQYKLIKLTFTHVDLGEGAGFKGGGACSDTDRLIVEEQGESPYCIQGGTRTRTSKSNQIKLRLVTNFQRGASGSSLTPPMGFRGFYAEEWPCDASLAASASGLFASPDWPDSYPPAAHCLYRITAPNDRLTVRIRFNAFSLYQDSLGCRIRSFALIFVILILIDISVVDVVISLLTITIMGGQHHKRRSNNEVVSFIIDCYGEQGNYDVDDADINQDEDDEYQREGTNPTTFVFTHSLIKHSLGHCTDRTDNVKLLDGGTQSSPVIGQYCGRHEAGLSVRSSGRDLLVQFFSAPRYFSSNNKISSLGFHATYWYENLNGTVWSKTVANVTILDRPRSRDQNVDQSLGNNHDFDFLYSSESHRIKGQLKSLGGGVVEEGGGSKGLIAGLICMTALVILLVIGLLLIVRHYRKIVSGYRKTAMVKNRTTNISVGRAGGSGGEGDRDEMVPLYNISSQSQPVALTPAPSPPSNIRPHLQRRLPKDQKQFNNVVELSNTASTSANQRARNVAAVEGDDQSYSADSCSPSCDSAALLKQPDTLVSASMDQADSQHPVPPARPHRPASMYGKYHADNMRNINRIPSDTESKSASAGTPMNT